MELRRAASVGLTLVAATAVHEVLPTQLVKACELSMGGGNCPRAFATTGVDVLSATGSAALLAAILVLGIATALRWNHVLGLATAIVGAAVATVPFLAVARTRTLHPWPTPPIGLTVHWPYLGDGVALMGREVHREIFVSPDAVSLVLAGFAIFVVAIAGSTAWRERHVPASRENQSPVRVT